MYNNEYVRACRYLVKNKTTIRGAAKEFNLPKSSLHTYIHTKLYKYCIYYSCTKLYLDVLNQIYLNDDMKHIRGGEATKQKKLLAKKRVNP